MSEAQGWREVFRRGVCAPLRHDSLHLPSVSTNPAAEPPDSPPHQRTIAVFLPLSPQTPLFFCVLLPPTLRLSLSGDILYFPRCQQTPQSVSASVRLSRLSHFPPPTPEYIVTKEPGSPRVELQSSFHQRGERR